MCIRDRLLADLGVEPLNDPSLPVLPAAWSWTQVQEVGQVDLGRQRSPKYHSGDNMKPYLRVANVFDDRIDTSDVMEMHFEPEPFEPSRLLVCDILLNEGQTPELLGRPAMYRGEPPEVAFTNSLLRFRAGPGIEPDWALVVFRHHMHSGRFTRESRITTNIAHLSAARFKPVEFPVPPIEEQRRIVEELDRLSSVMAAGERAGRWGAGRLPASRGAGASGVCKMHGVWCRFCCRGRGSGVCRRCCCGAGWNVTAGWCAEVARGAGPGGSGGCQNSHWRWATHSPFQTIGQVGWIIAS